MSVADELRKLYPRVLAKTVGLTRGVVDAEDAVQDALERALESWPRSGLPDSPEAWLVTAAANCYRDRLRQKKREERRADALATLAEMSPWVQGAIVAPEIARGWKDDLLRLLFACCHPALELGESAALALATVLGLSSVEIAAAFAIAPRSMDQRLTRARRRLREQGDCEAPPSERAEGRLAAVTAVIRLLFNEGYWSTSDDAPIRGELCRLAIGLGHSLLDAFPEEPEVKGLLALMMLHEARRGARLDSDGSPVPLPEQDRSRWNPDMMAEAGALLERALAAGAPGPLQLEAAISATHCRAKAAADTDWAEIAALYAMLERVQPTSATRVNRAFAVARAAGPREGLTLLDDSVKSEPYAHLVRGALLEELGRDEDAVSALEQAVANARNAHEARQIESRIRGIRERRQR